MKRKILATLLAVSVTLTLLFTACTPNSAAAPTAGPITVTDQVGNVITLDAPAAKVVALTPALNEIIFALGAGNIIVGRGEYCDYPAEVLNIPAVNSGADTNIEQILALNPQLVLMATMAQDPEQAKQLTDAGIQVYSSDAASISETYESIAQVGALIGKKAEADALTASMKAELDELAKNKLSGTIYFEVSPLTYGAPWSAGKGTFMDEVAELMGLTNIFADVNGWVEVSEEQILARNPDYIMSISMYFGDGLTPIEEILLRTAWSDVTAIKNGAILNLPDNELSRPGPRLVDGAKALYDFVKNAG